MEPYSSFDYASLATEAAVTESNGTESEKPVQQNNGRRTPPASVSAGLGAVRAEAGACLSSAGLASDKLASANLASSVRFPGEDGGRSLADMAQRDLDAALQLLVDRAQYITGASGVAIALRRDGRNDMLCRASTGSNAPELGALLSTEFGLSGESVRTRQALRCDDAERDARVNREVCRQLGIASVVVMPIVNDDGVLGVFELFSGKANAFGERDVSAVQRLSEMVETAVRLAQAAETLPERLKMPLSCETEVADGAVAEDQVLDGQILAAQNLDRPVLPEKVLEDQILEEPAVEAAAAGASGAEALGEKGSVSAAPETQRQSTAADDPRPHRSSQQIPEAIPGTIAHQRSAGSGNLGRRLSQC